MGSYLLADSFEWGSARIRMSCLTSWGLTAHVVAPVVQSTP
jgi:hypothetical protein